MSGNATITAFGTASVGATSPDTQAAIAAALAAVNAGPLAGQRTWDGTGSPPTPTPGQVSSLVITGPVSSDFVIPAGYSTVVIPAGTTGKITGGDANTTIVGDGFNYTGNAGKVVSGDGNSSIVDNAPNATIEIGSGGSATVNATGAGANVGVGDSGNAVINASGANAAIVAGRGSHTNLTISGDGSSLTVKDGGQDTLVASGNNFTFTAGKGVSTNDTVTGTGDVFTFGVSSLSQAPRGQAAAPVAPVFTNVVQGQTGHGNTYTVTDPNGVNELVLGVADTVNASAGLSTIFGLSADSVVGGAGSVFFVGGSGASTILGGSTNATVFATTGQQFDLGSAQGNVFVGGTAASTINAHSGGGSFFGGSHGELYNFGTGAAQVFVGTGGSDTLGGGAGTVAPTIFATGAEHLTFTTGTSAVTVVSLANGGSVDLSSTGGNNVVFGGYGGNQTLIGAGAATAGAATHDTFIVGNNASSSPTALTVENWHAGDVFYLTGFTAADTKTMDTAISNDLATGAKGNLSFTLSDNTTVIFLANHPTNFSASAAF